jgi:ABC-type sugar transport system ATPase subunit
MKQGMVLVPEGREQAGLALTMSVAENLALPQVARQRRPGLPVDSRISKQVAAVWMDRLDIKPRAPQQPAGKLSGGNQQKVLMAKWLATAPRLLVLHEPTQAVDVGARQTIIAAIREAAAAGCAVLVAGADENELSLLCDRVLIVRDGRVADELIGDFGPDDIVHRTYASSLRRALRPSRQGEDER